MADAVAATGGRLLEGDPGDTFDGAGIDSRTISPGALFVPVRGDRDGHDFVPAAVAAGAGGYLTAAGRRVGGAFAIGVEDTEAALWGIGVLARTRVPEVVAITGSVGKTTTKDFLGHALGTSMVVGVTHASFNNELGMPITLLDAPEGAELVVAEIGERNPGDVHRGAELLRPRVGIVTNVGSAHVGVFGSMEAVEAGIGELPAALPAGGVAVLNADDPATPRLAARTGADVLSFGFDRGDVRAESLDIGGDLEARFGLRTPGGSASCRLRAAGPHIVHCALAAAAGAHALGVDVAEVAEALSAAHRSPHRMALHRAAGGWWILNDAYNANPDSMGAAIDSAARLAAGRGRPLALLGHMAELGDHAEEAHRRVGAQVREAGLLVVATGEHAELLSTHVAGSVTEAAALLRELAGGFRPDDVILLKASRVMGLEGAVALLETEA